MDEIEAAKSLLDQHKDYRVLERLDMPSSFIEQIPSNAKRGIYLDIETTGLNIEVDEIIEIAAVPFYFSSTGALYGIQRPLCMLQEPSSGEIPAEITKITGIRNEDVQGHAIDWPVVRETVSGAAIVIAHNAAFDRPFLEKAEPMFSTKAWGCSLNDIDWGHEGFESAKLEYLALKSGFFYEGHRADVDCYAGLKLLGMELPQSSGTALLHLLNNARRTSCRIWAEHAPFDFKDHLKGRGYRWNDGSDGRPRAWYRDLDENRSSEELNWLRREIYQNEDADPSCTRFNAFDRYSQRV